MSPQRLTFSTKKKKVTESLGQPCDEQQQKTPTMVPNTTQKPERENDKNQLPSDGQLKSN